ncbi:MAG: hypothetical protein Q6373_007180 [Candidatus Sigynarchaeota archaeon]
MKKEERIVFFFIFFLWIPVINLTIFFFSLNSFEIPQLNWMFLGYMIWQGCYIAYTLFLVVRHENIHQSYLKHRIGAGFGLVGVGAIYCYLFVLINPNLPSLVSESSVLHYIIDLFQWFGIPVGIYSAFVALLFGLFVVLFGPVNPLIKLITYDFFPIQLENVVNIHDPRTGIIIGKKGIIKVRDDNSSKKETRITMFLYSFKRAVYPVAFIKLGSNRLDNWVIEKFKQEKILCDFLKRIESVEDLSESMKKIVEIARTSLMPERNEEAEMILKNRIIREVIPWTGGVLCDKCKGIVNVDQDGKQFSCIFCNDRFFDLNR